MFEPRRCEFEIRNSKFEIPNHPPKGETADHADRRRWPPTRPMLDAGCWMLDAGSTRPPSARSPPITQQAPPIFIAADCSNLLHRQARATRTPGFLTQRRGGAETQGVRFEASSSGEILAVSRRPGTADHFRVDSSSSAICPLRFCALASLRFFLCVSPLCLCVSVVFLPWVGGGVAIPNSTFLIPHS
jgi:hypothetical protein